MANFGVRTSNAPRTIPNVVQKPTGGSSIGLNGTSRKPATSTTSGTTAQSQSQQEVLNSLKTSVIDETTRGTSTTSTTQREQGKTIVDQMDAKTREAYNKLLEELQAGGSASQRQATSGKITALLNAQTKEQGYSVDAAREQAQQGVSLATQKFQETILPQLANAMEAAGISGDSLAALLAQDAASRAGRQSADAEAALIAQYGELAQGQQAVALEATKQLSDDPVQAALLQALEIGKGSLTTTTTDNLITGTQTVNSESRRTGTTTENTSGTSSSSMTSSGSTSTTGNDLIGLMNAQSNQTNAASASRLSDIQALEALSKLMPGGTNLLGSLAVANSPTKGEVGALALGGGGPQVTQFAGIDNLLRSLGLRA